MTFKELAELQRKELAKQRPVTLRIAQQQVLWLTVRSTSRTKEEKDEKLSQLLGCHHPNWTQKQINNRIDKLYKKYL